MKKTQITKRMFGLGMVELVVHGAANQLICSGWPYVLLSCCTVWSTILAVPNIVDEVLVLLGGLHRQINNEFWWIL